MSASQELVSFVELYFAEWNVVCDQVEGAGVMMDQNLAGSKYYEDVLVPKIKESLSRLTPLEFEKLANLLDRDVEVKEVIRSVMATMRRKKGAT